MDEREHIYWAVAHESEVPGGDDWLGPRERALQAPLLVPARRASFRLGRWVGKCAAARALGIARASLEIGRDPDGSPVALDRGHRLAATLSLSHRVGWGMCAVRAGAAPLGCDLERVEPRSAAFIEDWFTARERAAVMAAADPSLRANLGWSAKESALKAIRTGLSRDTRDVEIELDVGEPSAIWQPLRLLVAGGVEPLRGAYRRAGETLMTVVFA